MTNDLDGSPTAPDPLARVGGGLRWVRRNDDKPHRCPDCHRVAQWHHSDYDHHRDRRHGPRTRMWCIYCRVQWRMGDRSTGDSTLFVKRLQSGGYLPGDVPRFVDYTSVGRRRRGGRS